MAKSQFVPDIMKTLPNVKIVSQRDEMTSMTFDQHMLISKKKFTSFVSSVTLLKNEPK